LNYKIKNISKILNFTVNEIPSNIQDYCSYYRNERLPA